MPLPDLMCGRHLLMPAATGGVSTLLWLCLAVSMINWMMKHCWVLIIGTLIFIVYEASLFLLEKKREVIVTVVLNIYYYYYIFFIDLFLFAQNSQWKLNNYTLLQGCEPGYSLVGDACYLYVGAPVTYEEAKAFCKKDNASLPFLQKWYWEVQVMKIYCSTFVDI